VLRRDEGSAAFDAEERCEIELDSSGGDGALQQRRHQGDVAELTKEKLMAMLANKTPDEVRNILGTRLYALIEEEQRSRLVAKITGMFLEGMSTQDLATMIYDQGELHEGITQALDLLDRHTEATRLQALMRRKASAAAYRAALQRKIQETAGVQEKHRNALMPHGNSVGTQVHEGVAQNCFCELVNRKTGKRVWASARWSTQGAEVTSSSWPLSGAVMGLWRTLSSGPLGKDNFTHAVRLCVKIMDAQDGLLTVDDGQGMGRAIIARGGSWQETLKHVSSNGWGPTVCGDERQIKTGEQPPLLLGHFVGDPSLIGKWGLQKYPWHKSTSNDKAVEARQEVNQEVCASTLRTQAPRMTPQEPVQQSARTMTLYEKAVERAAEEGMDWTLTENHPNDRAAESRIGPPRTQHVGTRQRIGFERDFTTENSRVVKGTRKFNGGTVKAGEGSPVKRAAAATTLRAQAGGECLRGVQSSDHSADSSDSGLGSDEESGRGTRTSFGAVGKKHAVSSPWGKNIQHTSGLRGGMQRQAGQGASGAKGSAGEAGNLEKIRAQMHQMLLTSPIRTGPMEEDDEEGSCVSWGGSSYTAGIKEGDFQETLKDKIVLLFDVVDAWGGAGGVRAMLETPDQWWAPTSTSSRKQAAKQSVEPDDERFLLFAQALKQAIADQKLCGLEVLENQRYDRKMPPCAYLGSDLSMCKVVIEGFLPSNADLKSGAPHLNQILAKIDPDIARNVPKLLRAPRDLVMDGDGRRHAEAGPAESAPIFVIVYVLVGML
jgi:hypothetical protein